MWYEQRQKQESAEMLVDRCLSDMERRLRVLDSVVDLYHVHDSLYTLATSQPLDSLSDEVLGSLIFEFTVQYNLVISHAYEKSFSQSVISHEQLGHFAEVISEGYEYLNLAEQQHEKIKDLQGELFRRQALAKNTYWDKGSMASVVEEALKDPFFTIFQQEFMSHSNSVRHMRYVMKNFIPRARELWNGEISEEEFQKITTERWNQWKFEE